MQNIRQRRSARVIWGVLLLAHFLTGCEGTQAASNGSPSRSASGLHGTDLGAKPAPAFQLVDQNRQVISLTQFTGMPVVITFFYTHCPTSCPLIADKIRTALVQLGSAAQHVAILAISVDPSGDTPASAHDMRNEPAEQFLAAFIRSSC